MTDHEAVYPLGPALNFLRGVWEMNHALEKLSLNMAQRLGVTAQQRLVLRCVGKFPGVTAGQLATLLHLDPGTVSAALKRLEEKALLERRKDPRDRRRVTLGLTAQGRFLDRPGPGTVENAVTRMLGQVSAADLSATTDVLEKLTASLGQELDGVFSVNDGA
jgi:MarR family transcriptional regulator, organic hydroperoxide resistance regulator